MNEKSLVEACLDGNYRAQKKLYQLHCAQMMGICMRYGSSIADAEDILQDGFLKVFTHLDTYSGTGRWAGGSGVL